LSRIILERLAVTVLLKLLLAFYAALLFITLFTIAFS
jgi:hypothetical protein